MALALGIAIGSVVQIAFFVIPLMVLIAWCVGQPLSLDFHIYQGIVLKKEIISSIAFLSLITFNSFFYFLVASIFLCIFIVAFVVNHGKSNWLQGVLLISAYCVIALGFWIHIDPQNP